MRLARRLSGIVGCLLMAALCVAMVACGDSLPAGTYASAAYHFRVTYPSGWQVSASNGSVPDAWKTPTVSVTPAASPTPGAIVAVPLQVSITRTGARTTEVPVISTFAITVWDLHDLSAAAQAANLVHDPALHSVTIGGQQGYATVPVREPILPAGGTGGTTATGTAGTTASAVTDTHTDYYVLRDGFEYQISTDAISGDNADGALQAMLQSFTFTA